MTKIAKPQRVSLPITRDDRLSRQRTARRLQITTDGTKVKVGVEEGGKVSTDALEIGQTRHVGGIEVERTKARTLVIRDATGAQHEVALKELGANVSAAEQHLLTGFAAGLSQAAKTTKPTAIASDRPKVQRLLDAGMAPRIAALGRGEPGVKLLELMDVFTALEDMDMSPAEVARLAELETILQDAEYKPNDPLRDEKYDLEDRKAAHEDLANLRTLILEQLNAADLPDSAREAIAAHPSVTKDPLEPDDLLPLLSGELFLPRAPAGMKKNFDAAAAGRVWIEGTTTPSPYSVKHMLEYAAINEAPVSEAEKTSYRAQAVLYPEAWRFDGPEEPVHRFELMKTMGVQTLHELYEVYHHQGDGGYYAQQLIVAFARAKKSGAKEVKAFIKTHEVGDMTSLAYAYRSFIERPPNLLVPTALSPDDIGKLVGALRFDQFAKLLTASHKGGRRFGALMKAHGLKKLIHFVKTKTPDELAEMEKAAQGDAPKQYYAATYPADAELASKIDAPPLDEVVKMTRNLADGGLTTDEAKSLHAIIDRHLRPNYQGETKGGGYTLSEMNQYWGGVSSFGPVVLTPEHIALRNTLNQDAGRVGAQIRDIQSQQSKSDIVGLFAKSAKSHEGVDTLLHAAGSALRSAVEAHDLNSHYEAQLERYDEGKNKKLFNPPGAIAELLDVLSQAGTSNEDVDAAMKAVQKPYRSLETTVNDYGSFHRLRTAASLGGGDQMELDLSTSKTGISMYLSLPDMSEDSSGAFAQIETFAHGGARYKFGGGLEPGANPAAASIGSRLFAEALVACADKSISDLETGGDYARERFGALIVRSALELTRLPASELHQPIAGPGGDLGSPAQAFARLAKAQGLDVGSKPLDADTIAELGARVQAEAMVRPATYYTKQLDEKSEHLRRREILERLAPSFAALSPIPAADRFVAKADELSPGDALVNLAAALGLEACADPRTAAGWQELTALAVAAQLPAEENMLVWAATKLKSERGMIKLRGVLAELGHVLASVPAEALAKKQPEAKTSALAALRSMAAAAELGVGEDASAAEILKAARALPERVPIDRILSQSFSRDKEIYLSPS